MEVPSTASWNSLLVVLFRVVAWRIVTCLARPVTPEVAGSSPVAPVPNRAESVRNHCATSFDALSQGEGVPR